MICERTLFIGKRYANRLDQFSCDITYIDIFNLIKVFAVNVNYHYLSLHDWIIVKTSSVAALSIPRDKMRE
jgi:hypothetical protein